MAGRLTRGRWPVIVAVLVVVLAAGVITLVTLGGPGFQAEDTATPTGGTPTDSTATDSTATMTAPPTSTGAEPSDKPTETTSAPAPPPGVPPELRGQDLEAIPTSRRVVALTFDAGANGDGLPSILGTLDAKGVPATFFLTGQWAAANPAGVERIAAAGHRIGNHSMTHPQFTGLSAEQIRTELDRATAAIRAGGADPRPLFRFPFGDRDARTIAAVNDLGYLPVRWTVDTLGWQGTSGGRSAQQVADRALAGLRPGEIVLMHIGSNPDDGSTLDADALPQMIDRIRGAGYDFVTLDALLG